SGTAFCGRNTGKTLVITAGVHGGEYVGIETAPVFRRSTMKVPTF
ncbi:hypothetical protein HMPREF1135_02659, partial [Lachnoanaerobaculum sp. OBRC5-5]